MDMLIDPKPNFFLKNFLAIHKMDPRKSLTFYFQGVWRGEKAQVRVFFFVFLSGFF